MATRKIHVVKVTCPTQDTSGGTFWVNVAVVDSITLRSVNGDEIGYNVTAANASPYIKDDTGDRGDVGAPNSCSRVSHLERITFGVGSGGDGFAGNETNRPAYFFDAEVLDALSFRGENGKEITLSFPKNQSTINIIDNTGNNLAQTQANATRSGHIVELDYNETLYADTINATNVFNGTISTNSDDGGTTGNPTGQCLIVQKTDAIAFIGPNGDETLLYIPWKDAVEIDTTQYDGNGNPPENTDPNPYIVWPSTTVTDSFGNTLTTQGAWTGNGNCSTFSFTGPSPSPQFCPIINQGPLWYIKSLGYSVDFRSYSLVIPAGTYNIYEVDNTGVVDVYETITFATDKALFSGSLSSMESIQSEYNGNIGIAVPPPPSQASDAGWFVGTYDALQASFQRWVSFNPSDTDATFRIGLAPANIVLD